MHTLRKFTRFAAGISGEPATRSVGFPQVDRSASTVATGPVPPQKVGPRETAETRQAAEIELFKGIGSAHETNLVLAGMLREAIDLVDDMTAYSGGFEASAERMHWRADQFVASLCNLQSQSDQIETELATANDAVEQAQRSTQSALGSVGDLTSSINEIERVIKMIASIAAQTNLLALNATIEAARAGAAGAGFRVVAGEVKTLSSRIQTAADEIVASVKNVRQRAAVNTAEVRAISDNIAGLENVFKGIHTTVLSQGEQTRSIGLGSESVASLAQEVRSNAGQLRARGKSVLSITQSAEQAAQRARSAFSSLTDKALVVLRQSEIEGEAGNVRWPLIASGFLSDGDIVYPVRLLDLSLVGMQIETPTDLPDRLVGKVLNLSVEIFGTCAVTLLTPTANGYEAVLVDPSEIVRSKIGSETALLRERYAPLVRRVQDVAADLEGRLAALLDEGALTIESMFDTQYRRRGAAEPALYTNQAVSVLDGRLRGFFDRMLEGDPRPEFCQITDRNGFSPVHNSYCSHEPRMGDYLWNVRHARSGRIFDDRVGLCAARSLRSFLVQSYARDMGDSIEMLMEFDAPIFVRDRHWGAVRMGYMLR